MRTIDAIIAGIQLLAAKHGAYVSAEHDEIFVSTDEDVTAQDRAGLAEAGWTYDESTGAWRRYV